MTKETTVNTQEITKFAQYANNWWDRKGPLKTLHDINPLRLSYVEQHAQIDQQQILDVGCGGGIFSEALAINGANVTGLDAEENAIITAQQHAQLNHVSVKYVCSSIEKFISEPFDFITCMEMLEHVDSPKMVLNHCHRLLKNEGLLFLSTINRSLKSYLHAVVGAEYILKLLPRQTHDYNKFIKPAELVRIARESGFELLDLSGMNYNPWSRKASFTQDVQVNYLLTLKKV